MALLEANAFYITKQQNLHLSPKKLLRKNRAIAFCLQSNFLEIPIQQPRFYFHSAPPICVQSHTSSIKNASTPGSFSQSPASLTWASTPAQPSATVQPKSRPSSITQRVDLVLGVSCTACTIATWFGWWKLWDGESNGGSDQGETTGAAK